MMHYACMLFRSPADAFSKQPYHVLAGMLLDVLHTIEDLAVKKKVTLQHYMDMAYCCISCLPHKYTGCKQLLPSFEHNGTHLLSTTLASLQVTHLFRQTGTILLTAAGCTLDVLRIWGR